MICEEFKQQNGLHRPADDWQWINKDKRKNPESNPHFAFGSRYHCPPGHSRAVAMLNAAQQYTIEQRWISGRVGETMQAFRCEISAATRRCQQGSSRGMQAKAARRADSFLAHDWLTLAARFHFFRLCSSAALRCGLWPALANLLLASLCQIHATFCCGSRSAKAPLVDHEQSLDMDSACDGGELG